MATSPLCEKGSWHFFVNTGKHSCNTLCPKQSSEHIVYAVYISAATAIYFVKYLCKARDALACNAVRNGPFNPWMSFLIMGIIIFGVSSYARKPTQWFLKSVYRECQKHN